MATVTVYDQAQAFLTKDGSIVRELMHPVRHGNARQSLAEATVPPGTRTVLHRHARSEELYYIVAGEGRMFLDHDTFAVTVGDSICIPPGTPTCDCRYRYRGAAPAVLLRAGLFGRRHRAADMTYGRV